MSVVCIGGPCDGRRLNLVQPRIEVAYSPYTTVSYDANDDVLECVDALRARYVFMNLAGTSQFSVYAYVHEGMSRIDALNWLVMHHRTPMQDV